MKMGCIKLYGESVRGTAHIRADKPCQDRFRYKEVTDDISILAVADGHGSDACPFSGEGAQIAVDTFFAVMEPLIASAAEPRNGNENFADNAQRFLSFLHRGEAVIAQKIEMEWKDRVQNAWEKDNKKSEEGNMAKTDVDESGDDSDPKDESVDDICQLYGTTLLGLVILPDGYVWAFQLGDGDIMYIDQEQVFPLVEADKLLGTQTHSLASKNAWRKAATALRRLDAKTAPQAPHLYMLSTDGFANSYTTTKKFEQTCQDYYLTIQQHGWEAVTENLRDWLNETSSLGCGDDVTVVMAYYDSNDGKSSTEDTEEKADMRERGESDGEQIADRVAAVLGKLTAGMEKMTAAESADALRMAESAYRQKENDLQEDRRIFIPCKESEENDCETDDLF